MLQRHKILQRKRLKSGAQRHHFKVGDQVWRQNIRSQQRNGGKLDANFLGPYIITEIQGKNVSLLGEKGGIHHQVNIDHLKLAKEEMPHIPHKIGITGLSPTPASQTSAPLHYSLA